MSFSSICRAVVAPALTVALASSGLAAHAATKAATTTTIVSTQKAAAKQPVLGMVTPARDGHRMVVKYYKKNGTSWVLRATKRPVIGQGDAVPGSGWYFAQFKAARKGTCKVVARYPGDSKYRASRAGLVVSCATGLRR